MPRNVRNFWLELDVDGRKPIATGPQSARGEFTLTIKQRNEGAVELAATVFGRARQDGTLELYWDNEQGHIRLMKGTKR